jgi:hypothetical protein
MAFDLAPPHHRVMTLSEFREIPDNPRQRNTDLHLKKAVKYLSSPSPAQTVVHVAELPDGHMFKLDGHTRALFWEQNSDSAPDYLSVMIYDVASIDDVMDLYTHFDNVQASEVSRDQWTGAWREIGFHPQNPRLQRGEGGYPLRMAHAGYCGLVGFSKESPYTIAHQWKGALILADKITDMRAKLVHVGIWAAMFATFKKDGTSALPFWQAYFAEAGTDDGKTFDAVKYLLEKRVEVGKTKATEELRFAALALGSYRRWKNGVRLRRRAQNGYPQRPDPISIADFLKGVRGRDEAMAKLANRKPFRSLPESR